MIETINGDKKINGKGHPSEVRIPDMFGFIMSATPTVNPHQYQFKVKAAADAFIADYLKMDKHEAAKNRKADFCFCASAMAPHADAEALRTMVDWLNWECIAVGCDLAWIHDDIVSYKKDVKSGIEHNFVTVLKKSGFTTQQAMDRAGELQDECYRRWYLALASMPIWGEATDHEFISQFKSSVTTMSSQEESPKLEVAIAGGGIAGLITAIALLKHLNVNVQVYERTPEFKEIGASIALGPNGLRTLDRLGVENALAEGFAQRQKSEYPMIYRHWKTGEVIDYDVHSTVQRRKHATARFHRAHLHQALLENLPEGIVHLGKTTVDVKADPDEGATLYFEDGTTATADIVIGADGLWSKVRNTFVPEHELHWTGWVAFRAVFDADRLKDVEYPEDAAHWAGHETTFFHSHLGKRSVLPLGGYHADPQDPKSPGQDAKWDEDGSVEEFKRLYQHWNPTIRAFIEATPYVKLFPNYAGAALDTWSFSNRVALVGDAAHTHGGSFAAGGSLAIDDAYALYRSLDHVWPPSSARTGKPTRAQLAQVFELYEATRKPHLDKLLSIVHKNISGQKSNIERAATETDEQLRLRVKGRMNPSWISEHDVVAAFEQAAERIEGGQKPVQEPRARL
ncbi:Monooxygenase, FAD-binding [Fusarium agapanthi]|uniref:Monooxygenase, FAD-binding n=1 Tax=Fusarium agapanthi TaxID=1803897 RepID=A0A9P5EGR4_9HYPO|nr:Monooxygenase, FAD-binding [Fusarium agapanthi]